MQKIFLAIFFLVSAGASANSRNCNEQVTKQMKKCNDAVRTAKKNSAAYISAASAGLKKFGSDQVGNVQSNVANNGIANAGDAEKTCDEARQLCQWYCENAAKDANTNNDQVALQDIASNDKRCKDFTKKQIAGLKGESGNLQAQGVGGGQAVSAMSH